MKCEACNNLWMKHQRWMRAFYLGALHMKMPNDAIKLAREDLKRLHKANKYGNHSDGKSRDSS